jgi:hypothetical protein
MQKTPYTAPSVDRKGSIRELTRGGAGDGVIDAWYDWRQHAPVTS